MTFGQAVSSCFSKYFTFNGRAPRSEYWWFSLFVLIAQSVLMFVDIKFIGITYHASPNPAYDYVYLGLLSGIFSLVVFLPSISVMVRRLHDTDHSGWWYWIVLVPVVGIIVLLVFLVTRGTLGPNRFGEDPLSGQ